MKLKRVDCSDCKEYLIDAPVGSQVYCPRCKKWMESEGGDDGQTKQKQLFTDTGRQSD